MKTKLLITAIFLLSFLENSFSQEYHPFLNNSSWILNDMVSCCRQPYIRNINEGVDVVIGAYTYKKFNDPFPSYGSTPGVYLDSIAIREDVTERKVYKMVEGVEVLLYDFSLETGDTIFINGYTWTASVDAFECNGNPRKRITLTTTAGNYTLTQRWIEGVGSNAHPFYPARNIYSVMSSGGGYNIYTKCSFQDGAHIYGNADYCGLQMLGTANPVFNQDNVVFSPNPVVSELTIDAQSALQDATFKMYNVQGQLVREIGRLNGQKVTIGRENLNSGLYFIQLFENGKPIKSGKILVD